jgi:hypothetical protein
MKQKRKSHRAPLFKLPIDSKADELERKIAEAVHNECQQDLAELEQAGIPPRALSFAAIQIVKESWKTMSEELKERFRDRADTMKQFSAYLEKMIRKTRAFSTPEIECMKVQAESMRNGSLQVGKLLKIFRKDHDQGVAILLAGLREDFNSWEALHRVLATAFDVAGIESKNINADNLRKAAKRNRTLFRHLHEIVERNQTRTLETGE